VGSPVAELRRFYVDRQWHGTGLAQELMDRVIATSSDDGVGVLWLGVWERNPRAIRFYHGFGFSEAGDQVFVLGTDKQRDVVMVLTLTASERSTRQDDGSTSGCLS
jgi:ribosomal protein S18 acetylase RimI-like enzyme